MFQPANILIIRQDALGDLVTSFPLAGILQKLWPDARVTIMAKKPFLPLIERLAGVEAMEYREIEPKRMDKSQADWRSQRRANQKWLAAGLGQGEFDLVIHAFPRPYLAWTTFRSGIPYRLGTANRLYSPLFNYRWADSRKSSEHHEAIFTIRLLLGLPLTPEQRKWLEQEQNRYMEYAPALETYPVNEADPYIVIHPLKTMSSLRWSLDHFRDLTQKILANPTLEGFQIKLTGIPAENEAILGLVDEIGEDSGRIQIHTDLTIVQLLDIIAGAKAWIGNSTGPLHIAAYAKTPVLGLFGRAPAFAARRWGPIYHSGNRALEPEVPPCKKCIYEKCEYFNCVDRIATAQVFSELKALLS